MARARTPAAKAAVSGAAAKNPGRHAGRKAVAGDELGAPPSYMANSFARKAFELFKQELPWLKESHRVLVEMASMMRGRMMDPEDHLPFQAAQELRRCLAQLGATPADESRVNIGGDGEIDEDEQRFNAASASAGSGPPAPPARTH